MVDFRHLRSFVMVAEELHFSRAAHRLGIVQSALSSHIRALEVEIGVRLLERTSRRVALTPAGADLYERGVHLLRGMQDAVSSAQGKGGKASQGFVIGAIHAAAFGPLPHFLKRLARKFPDAHISIRTGTTEAIIRDVEQGVVHFGFVRPFENIGALRYVSLAEDYYRLAIPNEDPLAAAPSIKLADLASRRLIVFSRANLSYSERHFANLFRASGLERNIAYRCDDTLSLYALVSAGLGIGFLPQWTAMLPEGSLTLRQVDDVSFRIGLGLVWNATDPTTHHDVFVEMAQGLAGP